MVSDTESTVKGRGSAKAPVRETKMQYQRRSTDGAIPQSWSLVPDSYEIGSRGVLATFTPTDNNPMGCGTVLLGQDGRCYAFAGEYVAAVENVQVA